MADYLCAFDLGTTGVKAGILTVDGELLGTAYREYNVRYPRPQWVEQSSEEMWRAQCAVSQQVLDQSGVPGDQIAGIGISCQRATFMALDSRLQPLTPFIGWQDRRSIEQCQRMCRLIGEEAYYQIAGLPIEPTAAVSKILWLQENEPEIFQRTRTFAATQTVHLLQLGVEETYCDLPDAAYMGLLDVDALVWSQELLDLLELPADRMPKLVPSGVEVGAVSRSAGEATSLVPGTPIVTAGGDLQVAGLGMGVAEPGVVSVGIGTGGGVLVYLDEPLRHPDVALNCLPHAAEGAWEMEGICLASGAAYRWFRDVVGRVEWEAAQDLNLDPYDVLNLQASKAKPGAKGLIVMPSLMGAGCPNWYPKARGAILGLTAATERKDLVRGMMEGICLEIRWMLEAAERLGPRIEEVRIWGGAAKSGLWNQIAADVYGVRAARTEVSEAGLVGAAICAGVGVGLFDSAQAGVKRMVRVADHYQPHPALTERYDEMVEIYKDAYHALVDAGIFERIAGLED